jgi:hypothetical protein
MTIVRISVNPLSVGGIRSISRAGQRVVQVGSFPKPTSASAFHVAIPTGQGDELNSLSNAGSVNFSHHRHNLRGP